MCSSHLGSRVIKASVSCMPWHFSQAWAVHPRTASLRLKSRKMGRWRENGARVRTKLLCLTVNGVNSTTLHPRHRDIGLRSSFTMSVDDGATISVRSLSPLGERVGVRGLQNYRETLTPHPTPLSMGEGADRACCPVDDQASRFQPW